MTEREVRQSIKGVSPRKAGAKRMQEGGESSRILTRCYMPEYAGDRERIGVHRDQGRWQWVIGLMWMLKRHPSREIRISGLNTQGLSLSRPLPPPLPPLTFLNTGKAPQIRLTWTSSRNMSCATETHCRSAHVVLPAGRLLIKGLLCGSHIIAGWVEMERMADARTSNFMFIGKGCLVLMGNG
jgi:hypothetical protein